MGLLSKFEGKMEDTVEGAASLMGGSSLSPVQITKRAEKQMKREKMVGAGTQYAPTLYSVLVSEEDDKRMFSYYPTLAGEIETYLTAKARELGYMMDGQPLVRFIADSELKRGKFDVVAELVAAPIIARLRSEEMERYGISSRGAGAGMAGAAGAGGMRRGAAGGGLVPVGAAAGAHSARPSVRGAAAYAADGGAAGGAPAGVANVRASGAKVIPTSNSQDFDRDSDTVLFGGAGAAGAGTAGAGAAGAGAAGAGRDFQDDYDEDLEAYLYDEDRDTAYTLTGNPQRIGRESANDIVVPDINVSRVHAEIRMEPDGTWVISDLGSTNGVYLNGRKVQSAPLRDADMILLGTSELEFQLL